MTVDGGNYYAHAAAAAAAAAVALPPPRYVAPHALRRSKGQPQVSCFVPPPRRIAVVVALVCYAYYQSSHGIITLKQHNNAMYIYYILST